MVAGLQRLLHVECWPGNVNMVSVKSGQWSADNDRFAADQWDVHNCSSGIYRHRRRSSIRTNACPDTTRRSVAKQEFCYL